VQALKSVVAAVDAVAAVLDAWGARAHEIRAEGACRQLLGVDIRILALGR